MMIRVTLLHSFYFHVFSKPTSGLIDSVANCNCNFHLKNSYLILAEQSHSEITIENNIIDKFTKGDLFHYLHKLYKLKNNYCSHNYKFNVNSYKVCLNEELKFYCIPRK